MLKHRLDLRQVKPYGADAGTGKAAPDGNGHGSASGGVWKGQSGWRSTFMPTSHVEIMKLKS